ncbi:DUF4942 domain-containing protein, partial [Shigella sonnei]|uniref:DUF4942 domain-containing protein n=1 Tax=Shigella sonnei TaxID=624 RepID=UPI00311AA77F
RVTLDCSGREALDDLVRPFYLLEGRNVPDFRNSIGAQYGEFLGNGDNVGKLLEGEYFTVRGYQKGTVHSASRIMSRSAFSPTSYPAFLSVSRTSVSV